MASNSWHAAYYFGSIMSDGVMCRPCRFFVRLSIYALNFTRVYALALYDSEPLLEMPSPSNVLRASFKFAAIHDCW